MPWSSAKQKKISYFQGLGQIEYTDNFHKHIDIIYEGIQEFGYKWGVTIQKQTANEMTMEGKQILNFSNCNYLGLGYNDDVKQEATNALNTLGYGIGSAPLMSGTLNVHKTLEAKICEFYGTADCLLYSSGYAANVGFFQVFLQPNDVIISDSANHASLIDGIRLSKAKRVVFKHNDMKDLERVLRENQKARFRCIVTEGIFSMDGDVCPLPATRALADKYNAIIFLDEAHSAGVLGPNGKGSPEHYGIDPKQIDFVGGTFSKSFGGVTGGYITGTQRSIEILRHCSRTYVFSHGIIPLIAATQCKMFDLVKDTDSQRVQLRKNTLRVRRELAAAGFKVLGEEIVPIIPVILGASRHAFEMAMKMLTEEEIYVVALPYPVVPEGSARIRLIVTARHTDEQITKVIEGFIRIGKEIGVLKA